MHHSLSSQRRAWSRRLVLLVLIATTTLTTGCFQAAPADPELERLTAIAERVTIIRDDFGVPHVYGESDADAVFGLLYAQAEDDFRRIERNYTWAIGRLAEAEGEEALFSDLRARLYMSIDEAKAHYESAPTWLKTLCGAFADGLNFYLATHPDVVPLVIERYEPWMPMFFFEGSIGGDIEQIPLDGIEAFYGRDEPIDLASLQEARAPRFGYDDHLGSNGFAIAGEHTASGDAMLLINPHTTFFFRGEVHVVSDEGLNAYGAVTWGQFFVYQGFNEDTGWMHTSTRVDFMDEFLEEIIEQEGELLYRYGEELRPVEVSEVTLRYKEGDSLAERTFPTYRTHHGPITHKTQDRWVATKINWDPPKALEQSFIRTKQDGLDGFNEMMQIRTNSSNNTVYADSSGNIAYYHGNFVPRRDPSLDYSQPVDGTDPATDWQGLHELDEIVSVTNPENGWIQNCNSTPFTSAGAWSPKASDYPVYMAPDPENYRGIHAVQVLEKLETSSDLTLDGLIEMAYDPYLPGLAVLVPSLVEAYDAAGPDEKLGPAIDVLRDWDFTVAVDSVPLTLAHFYGMQFRSDGSNPDRLRGMAQVELFANQSSHDERLEIFRATVKGLEEDFGSWQTPWGEVNRYQRLSGAIDLAYDDDAPSLPVGMASGDWGALASFRARRDPGTKRIYGSSGNSFVAVVEFGERVKAKTLLAGGQSGDPSSPHFDDQAERYANREFKDVAYYREDVEARKASTYRPGER